MAAWIPKRKLYTANLKATLLKPELILTSAEKVKIWTLYMHKHPFSWKKMRWKTVLHFSFTNQYDRLVRVMIASSILTSNTTSIEGQVSRTEERGGKEMFLVLPNQNIWAFVLFLFNNQFRSTSSAHPLEAVAVEIKSFNYLLSWG